MPKPTCIQCSSTDSLLWRNQESGQICNECYLGALGGGRDAAPGARSDDEESRAGAGEGAAARATGRGARRSTRAARHKAAPPPASVAPPRAAPTPRARGRRSALKRTPLKAPTATATLVTSEFIFFKGSYMQVGDIVSMLDVDGGTFYAQIRGFLTDQYCEKSAVVTWLLPTRASPPPEKCFDPATYIIGPEEELPRKLDYMEFVMHAPADYYRAGTPYPPGATELEAATGFIWTSMDAKERT